MKIFKKFLPLSLVLAFSLISIWPFVNSGFFPMHDNTQVARVFEMTKAIKDGMLPVRWSQDLGFGYGYPMFNFYDPLPYYVGAVFQLIGANALLATKLMMVLGILLAGVSMYFLAGEFWGKTGGVLSALFYMYAPYHALDIYVRGDVAEFWAFAFIPLLFYGLLMIHKREEWEYVVTAALSYAVIIVSHNLTAMMVTPFALVFALILAWQSTKQTRLFLAAAFVIGILISAFYFLPAILEMRYANVASIVANGFNFRDHFACLSQLWTSPWGYGGSAKGCNDGLSLMVGKYHIILTFLAAVFVIIVLLSKKLRGLFEKEKLAIIVFAFLGFLFSCFMTLQSSQFIWDLIKPMSYFQYPWRFLLMAVFFSSFLAGFTFWVLAKFIRNQYLSVAILVIASVLFIVVSAKFFVPQQYLAVDSNYYTNPYALQWTASKISDEYMPADFIPPQNPSGIASFDKLNSGDFQIISLQQTTQKILLDFNLNRPGKIILPVAYFPAWKAYLDQGSIQLQSNPKGMQVSLPQGQHHLSLNFAQTSIEIAADLLSLAGILGLFIGIIQLRKKYA
jgi:hypothetical protein